MHVTALLIIIRIIGIIGFIISCTCIIFDKNPQLLWLTILVISTMMLILGWVPREVSDSMNISQHSCVEDNSNSEEYNYCPFCGEKFT